MGFVLEKWLSNRDVFNCLVSKGFRIMEDLECYERSKVLSEIFKKNDLDFAKDVIKNGLYTNNIDPLLKSIDALQEDDITLVKHFLDIGCPINASDSKYSRFYAKKHSNNPLLVAIQKKKHNIIEYLFKKGAKYGIQELEAAGKTQDVAIIETLIKCGVKFAEEGGAVLRGALQIVHSQGPVVPSEQITMIKALLEAGADPNTKDDDGFTCGHIYVKNCRHHKNTKQEKEMILDMFLDKGLDIHARNNQGYTMLNVSSWWDVDLVDVLLSRGANPNQRDSKGQTQTFVEIKQRISAEQTEIFPELLDVLIKHGVDLNCRHHRHGTILTMILSSKHVAKMASTLKLLSEGEILLPTEDELKRALRGVYRPWIFPMVQSGCNLPEILSHLLVWNLDSSDHTDSEKAIGEKFAACVDPTFSMDENKSTRPPGGPVFYTTVHRLESLAIYTTRTQILRANGNKSIIPRTRELPIPHALQEMLMLQHFADPEYYFYRKDIDYDSSDAAEYYSSTQSTASSNSDDDSNDPWDDC